MPRPQLGNLLLLGRIRKLASPEILGQARTTLNSHDKQSADVAGDGFVEGVEVLGTAADDCDGGVSGKRERVEGIEEL